MSEMVERAAAAMAVNDGWGDWSTAHERSKDMWRCHARAAIAAMREPTEAMANAIDARGRDPGLIVNNWYRMIDAALR